MGDVLRLTGANYSLLFPDDRTNTTLNSSSPADNGIATTNFEAMLFEDGEIVATNLAALEAGPYLMTIDNVSGTFGAYKLNLTLPSHATYDLFIRHTTDMVTVRQDQFDLHTRSEVLSNSRGNVRYDMTVNTGGDDLTNNVATNILSTIRIRQRNHLAATFDPADLTLDETIQLQYENLGDTNPIRAIPS